MITWETLSGLAKAVVKLLPKHKSDPGPTIIYMAEGSHAELAASRSTIFLNLKTFKLPKPPKPPKPPEGPEA